MKKLNKTIFISGFADEISSNLDKQMQVVKNNMSYQCLRDVDGINIGKYTLEMFKEKVYDRLVKENIKISSIGSPIGKIFIDDEKAFEEQLKALDSLCQIANLINCKYIRIFSFYIKDEKFEENKDIVITKLKEFVKIAKKYNVILIHENEKDIYGDIASRCYELVKNINSENFKLAFDFANFVQCNEDTLKAYDLLKEYIEYVHIKDANNFDNINVLAGTGQGNIKVILDDLINKRNYEGFLTLEPHLAQFDGLKELELADVDEIIKKSDITGEQGYVMQYKALIKILEEIGVN